MICCRKQHQQKGKGVKCLKKVIILFMVRQVFVR